MATLKKYDLSGKEVGEVKLEEKLASAEANSQMIKDYIVALRANARQWSANTKGRSEVNHSNKKPHKQKGSGKARQGSLASPQYRGGGVVFGPKPKQDQHVRINRKERAKAIHALLAEKIKEERMIVLEDKALDSTLKEPKTKAVAGLLKALTLDGKRILFVGKAEYTEVESDGKKTRVSIRTDKYTNFKKSLSNLPKTAFTFASNLNGYDVCVSTAVVLSEGALAEIQEGLK